MNDVDSALSDIARLRGQLAASSRFRGLAPGIVAVTGLLALALGVWQDFAAQDDLRIWIVFAVICALLIGIQAVGRARRLHQSMADRLLGATFSRFLPAGAAGGLSGLIILAFAPEHARLLPGLWQIIMGMGVFAALPGLPRGMRWAGLFYFAVGGVSLALSGASGPATGWLMAIPFGLAQLLVAAILFHAGREGQNG